MPDKPAPNPKPPKWLSAMREAAFIVAIFLYFENREVKKESRDWQTKYYDEVRERENAQARINVRLLEAGFGKSDYSARVDTSVDSGQSENRKADPE